MRLRTRLLVAVVGSAVLPLLALLLARELVARRAAEGTLRGALEARVDAIGRERCEEGRLPPLPRLDDEAPRGRGPGFGRRRPFLGRRAFEVFFYGRDFTPRLAQSPPVPADAAAALSRGDGFALVPAGRPGAVWGALATGWDSEGCAYALAQLPAPPALLSLADLAAAALTLLAALAGATYLAAGPPVRRIRALAQAVRDSARNRYATGVAADGSDEIAQLGRAFDEASAVVRAQLVSAEKRETALREFVSHTSHDVAVPLSVLSGHLSEMRERVTRGAAVEAPLVAAAAQEAQYIGSLLQNLAAVARLETEDRLHDARPVEMAALVERVALRHAVPARDAGVELNHAVPAEPLFFAGDVTLLEQAVGNLVHNAIRHNRRGGHVAVVLDAVDGGFVLRVRDDGPGVSEAELSQLGEPRFRGGAARSRRPDGLGLGLSIVRAVALRHGLRLAFRRPQAGGLEVVLATPAPAAAAADPSGSRPPRA